jgi:glucose-6-phosphate 1-dehydrogenase
MAVPPAAIETIVRGLSAARLTRDHYRSRIVVEKPFGHDLASANALTTMLLRVFEESQLYRIDHYLGKETVQNILAFRFANALFEPIWDRRYIKNIQITVAEDVGVEHRGSYYDHAGALRDMIQNHLLRPVLRGLEPVVSLTPTSAHKKQTRRTSVDSEEQIHEFAARGMAQCCPAGGAGYRVGRASPDSFTGHTLHCCT